MKIINNKKFAMFNIAKLLIGAACVNAVTLHTETESALSELEAMNSPEVLELAEAESEAEWRKKKRGRRSSKRFYPTTSVKKSSLDTVKSMVRKL